MSLDFSIISVIDSYMYFIFFCRKEKGKAFFVKKRENILKNPKNWFHLLKMYLLLLGPYLCKVSSAKSVVSGIAFFGDFSVLKLSPFFFTQSPGLISSSRLLFSALIFFYFATAGMEYEASFNRFFPCWCLTGKSTFESVSLLLGQFKSIWESASAITVNHRGLSVLQSQTRLP